MFGKRNTVFLFLLLFFCCWVGGAQDSSHQLGQEDSNTVQVQVPNPSGSEAELRSLVKSMHSELTNLESILELSAAERDALFVANQRLTLEVEELRQANRKRYQYGVLTGVALTTSLGALVAALCYQGFASVK